MYTAWKRERMPWLHSLQSKIYLRTRRAEELDGELLRGLLPKGARGAQRSSARIALQVLAV